MMDLNHLHKALKENNSLLQTQFATFQESKQLYLNAFQQLEKLSQSEIEQQLAKDAWSGIYPTTDWDNTRRLVIPFAEQWRSFPEALDWAEKTLANQPITAVASDFILPKWDEPCPVGCIQVSLFQNYHEPHTKNIPHTELILVTVDEIIRDGATLATQKEYFDWRCFRTKAEKLIEYMEDVGDIYPDAVCLFNGCLSLPRYPIQVPWQKQYIEVVGELLEISSRTRIPVIGFLKNAYHQDIVAFISHLFPMPIPPLLRDNILFHSAMHWGEYSQVFFSTHYQGVLAPGPNWFAFCYMQTHPARLPLRLEFPQWILDESLMDHVLNLIRAECITSAGFPYSSVIAKNFTDLTNVNKEFFFRTIESFGLSY